MGFEPTLPNVTGWCFRPTKLRGHIYCLKIGRVGFEPTMFTLRVPVLQTGAFTVGIPSESYRTRFAGLERQPFGYGPNALAS